MEHAARTIHRQVLLKRATSVLCFSVVWTLIEAVFGAVAAVNSKSIAMSAFSVDSAVELLSGLVVLSRIWRETQVGEGVESVRLERFASAVVGVCLFVLAGFIAFKAGQSVSLRQLPNPTVLGVLIAVLSSLIMPWLALWKRHLGKALHSHALIGDAACGITCAYMAWTLLIGIALQRLFGWWWIDPVAALGILYFVLHEAFESLQAAWTGEAHHHHHHH